MTLRQENLWLDDGRPKGLGPGDTATGTPCRSKPARPGPSWCGGTPLHRMPTPGSSNWASHSPMSLLSHGERFADPTTIPAFQTVNPAGCTRELGLAQTVIPSPRSTSRTRRPAATPVSVGCNSQPMPSLPKRQQLDQEPLVSGGECGADLVERSFALVIAQPARKTADHTHQEQESTVSASVARLPVSWPIVRSGCGGASAIDRSPDEHDEHGSEDREDDPSRLQRSLVLVPAEQCPGQEPACE